MPNGLASVSYVPRRCLLPQKCSAIGIMASNTMSNSWLVSLLFPFTLYLYSLGQSPQTATLQMFESVEPHMGTLMRITLYARDTTQAASAFRAAFARISALDAALTDYQPQSELNRLTQTAVKRPVKVSDDLFAVLLKAEQFSQETNGAFDVTI